VLTAFGLALMGIFGSPVYPGVPGYASDVADARAWVAIIASAMGELRKVAPEPAAYVSESNFFEKDWRRSYWGANYERLRAIKRQYDPDGHQDSAARIGVLMVLKGDEQTAASRQLRDGRALVEGWQGLAYGRPNGQHR
jgi:Berberine and berberine like